MTRSRFESWFREVVIGAMLKRGGLVVFTMAFVWRRILRRTTVIAITGSLGKTTAKECLANVLSTEGRIFRSRNSPRVGDFPGDSQITPQAHSGTLDRSS